MALERVYPEISRYEGLVVRGAVGCGGVEYKGSLGRNNLGREAVLIRTSLIGRMGGLVVIDILPYKLGFCPLCYVS